MAHLVQHQTDQLWKFVIFRLRVMNDIVLTFCWRVAFGISNFIRVLRIAHFCEINSEKRYWCPRDASPSMKPSGKQSTDLNADLSWISWWQRFSLHRFFAVWLNMNERYSHADGQIGSWNDGIDFVQCLLSRSELTTVIPTSSNGKQHTLFPLFGPHHSPAPTPGFGYPFQNFMRFNSPVQNFKVGYLSREKRFFKTLEI